MIPSHLYIENFMCYENAYVDFNQFSSALIVGKLENNDLYSNGVGKTTIFKAIEYVLFNQADVNLENIIMDDAPHCKIVFDFTIGDQEYRLSRKRTKKGSTDLSLYERTGEAGTEEEVYHTIKTDERGNVYVPVTDKKYWKNISGSRASNTEADLDKLIKINFKSFRSTVHFMQNDFNGLATTTSEKRKGILKEALDLIVYAKLEKIAKEKQNALLKEIDKNKILLESLGNPKEDLIKLAADLSNIETVLAEKEELLKKLNGELVDVNATISDYNNILTNLESKFSSLLEREKGLLSEKIKLETSVKEYSTKKSNAVKSAKDLNTEIKTLKENQLKLVEIDYSQIEILNEQIVGKRDQITALNITVTNSLAEYEELKIPMPDDNICKHCRQPTTAEHRKECQKQISDRMKECQRIIKDSKGEVAKLNSEISTNQQTVNSLNLSKKKLEETNTNITSKNKEIQDKKALYDEYSSLLDKFNKELEEKNKEVESIKVEIENSSLEESKVVKSKILDNRKIATDLTNQIQTLNREISTHNSNKAVINHSILQKNNDVKKQEELTFSLIDLNEKVSSYPLVIQAFSTTGIPNLIIQNVLDDLQIEANNLLVQLKPGLQLTFSTAKTKDDGTEADSLDIFYQINGRDRYFEQLSGAQKLAVVFSLKLGLSFLLQKMIGMDIRFLLLDEIDQSLDKASVDAFADIVKFFQKDFKILVITHNDRLKDKFSHAILVEQNMNLVSRAKVVSSW